MHYAQLQVVFDHLYFIVGLAKKPTVFVHSCCLSLQKKNYYKCVHMHILCFRSLLFVKLLEFKESGKYECIPVFFFFLRRGMSCSSSREK